MTTEEAFADTARRVRDFCDARPALTPGELAAACRAAGLVSGSCIAAERTPHGYVLTHDDGCVVTLFP